ncbi:MAG: oligosaccharide flippase family protein [Candidatus Kapaibacterium sp.]
MINQFLKIFKKSRFVLYYQIVDKLFFFILFLILARLLSVDNYGNIVLLFSVSNILMFVFQFGLPVYLQRQVARNNVVDKSDLSSALYYGFTSFLISTFIMLLIFHFYYANTNYSLIVILHSFVYSFYFISILNSILLGKREEKIQFISYSSVRLLSIILIISLLIVYPSIILFILIGLIGNIIIALSFYKFILNKFTPVRNTTRSLSNSLKSIFIYSFPIGVAAMVNFLYDKIDIIIISEIIDIEKVAFYNIAYGVYKSSNLLFSFILVSGFTRVSSLSLRKFAVKIFLRKYSYYILTISVSASIALYFSSEILINLIYGEKYIPAVILLQYLSFSVIPLALNNLTGITMNGLGMYKENMYVVLIALLINIALNIVLLLNLGIIGAVYATIITEVFILICDAFYLKNKLW